MRANHAERSQTTKNQQNFPSNDLLGIALAALAAMVCVAIDYLTKEEL